MDRRPDLARSKRGQVRPGEPDRGRAGGPGPMLTDPFQAPPVSRGAPAGSRGTAAKGPADEVPGAGFRAARVAWPRGSGGDPPPGPSGLARPPEPPPAK